MRPLSTPTCQANGEIAGELTCITAGPPRLTPCPGNSKVNVSPVDRVPELTVFPLVTERMAVLVLPTGNTWGATFITGMMGAPCAAVPMAVASRSAATVRPRAPAE